MGKKVNVMVDLLKAGAFLTIRDDETGVMNRWAVTDAELKEIYATIEKLLPLLKAREEKPKPGLDTHGFQSDRE